MLAICPLGHESILEARSGAESRAPSFGEAIYEEALLA